jgi:hypothetical protein
MENTKNKSEIHPQIANEEEILKQMNEILEYLKNKNVFSII